MIKSKKNAFVGVFSLVLILLLLFLLIKPFLYLFGDLDQLKVFILDFGVFAPLVLILLQILQVLVAPIPGQLMGLVSGFLFGPVLGTIYTMLGVVIGSYIAFKLARKLGRPFVERLINKKILKKFDHLAKEKGSFTLFFIFLLPALPDDAICLIAGLTNIKIRNLVLIAFLGRLPGMFVLNLVGHGFGSSYSIILFFIVMLISVLIFYFRVKLEFFFSKFIK